MLFSDWNSGIINIQQSFENSDWIAIGDLAHKLAAPAKHMQAKSLYANLKILEMEAEKQNIPEIRNLISDIENEIMEINDFLKKKLIEG